MAILPTKKIPQLTAYGTALAGTEQLEIWVTNTSRRITARDFVLPAIDPILMTTNMSSTHPASRYLVSTPTIQVVDNGPGSTVQLNSLITGALPADPTGLIGLAAVNGVATTWTRSDATHALDQGIVPTWTAQHTFSRAGTNANPSVLISSTAPLTMIQETDAAADNRLWRIFASGEQLQFSILNDAVAVATDWMLVDRTGTTVDTVNIQGTAVQANGSNILTVATAFANPTASLGLAAVNGVATTAMRSDAAPALSQAITPTWTGAHTFSRTLTSVSDAGVVLNSATPAVILRESDAAVDNRIWDFEVDSEQLLGRAYNDSGGSAGNWLAVNRTGVTIDSIALAATTITLNGVAATDFARLSQLNGFTATTDFTQVAASGLSSSTGTPALILNETDASSTNRRWGLYAASEQLRMATFADASGAGVDFFTIDRTGTTVDTIALAATTITLNGVASSDFARLSVANTFTAAGTGLAAAAAIWSSTRPGIELNETDAAANNRVWTLEANGEDLTWYVVNDAGSASAAFLTVTRTSTTVDSIALAATTLSFTGNVSTPNTSVSEVGYKGAPPNSQSGNYELVLADASTDIVHPSGGGAGDTFTIPANGSVAFPVGTMISITNLDSNSISIAITTDTLTLAGTTSTGTRTLAQNGVATIKKTSSTGWIIYGVGLS